MKRAEMEKCMEIMGMEMKVGCVEMFVELMWFNGSKKLK